jgi:hypothetical protein
MVSSCALFRNSCWCTSVSPSSAVSRRRANSADLFRCEDIGVKRAYVRKIAFSIPLQVSLLGETESTTGLLQWLSTFSFACGPLLSFIHFCGLLFLFKYNKYVLYQHRYLYESVTIPFEYKPSNWSLGTNSFWQAEFLKFMTAQFIHFLKVWKSLEGSIHKNYFGSHST